MKREFLRILTHSDIQDWQLASTLATGIAYYCMVVDINIKMFPNLEANFADFRSGTDWANRTDTLANALVEAQATYVEDMKQHYEKS